MSLSRMNITLKNAVKEVEGISIYDCNSLYKLFLIKSVFELPIIGELTFEDLRSKVISELQKQISFQ